MNPFSINFSIPAKKNKSDIVAKYDPGMESTIIREDNGTAKLYIDDSRSILNTGSFITATKTDPTSDEATDR